MTDETGSATRAARELEHRLLLLAEVCRIMEERAVHHAAKALVNQGFWTEDYQTGKAQRLNELARCLGDPQFHEAIRSIPQLRALFSAHVPPPLPPRPRSKHTRRRKPVKPFNMADPTTFGFDTDVLSMIRGLGKQDDSDG
jgi:hypothetical protein